MTMLVAHANEVLLPVPAPADPLAELAESAARGDASATTVLLRALAPQIFAVLGAMVGRADPDLDDLAQDSMVALVRALGSFRFESSVAHFARRVALRRASVALRHRRAARRSAALTAVVDDLDERIESQAPSPLGATLAAERMEAFRDIVADLPEEQAEAFALRVVLGHSVEEIAKITGAPVNTVRGRLRVAKSTMRTRITSEPRLADVGEDGQR